MFDYSDSFKCTGDAFGDLDMSKSPIGIKFNDFCILLLMLPAVMSIVMTNPLN